MKILLVDDIYSDGELTQIILNKTYLPIELKIVNYFKEAAEIIEKEPCFDAYILDLKLDLGRSGMELVNFIKEKCPHGLIIILTGYYSPETTKELVNLGIQHVLNKDQLNIEKMRQILAKIE